VSRGIVWTGRRRGLALAVALAVGALPVAASAASAAPLPGPLAPAAGPAGPAPAAPAPGPAAPAAGPVAPAAGPAGDGKARVVGPRWGDKAADAAAKDPAAGTYDPRRDAGSLYTVTTAIGARDVWKQKDDAGRAVTGQGVTVAVVDSGVAAVPGLAAPGKVLRGPDLSLEVNSATPLGPDTFGHGTHMASIIAGEDGSVTDPRTGALKPLDPRAQLGVAPDAQLLALKLASTDGSTDVSQVVAGLDWVVAHQHDNGMDVRVVNLSFGTDSLQPYEVDPLAAAAENAWHHGIVVVVSGGNAGPDAGGLSDPAIDPYVIAVGASDPSGQVTGWASPTVASFSSRGTDARHVDLVAPGRSIVGLRNPGSTVDVANPQGLVTGDTSGRLFRGSGTSQAAAVVSGAAALLLQAQPSLTPDAVKAALVGTATPLSGASALDAGAGQLDVDAALAAVDRAADGRNRAAWPLSATQSFPVATGLGSLEAARGTSHLADPETGAVLAGEVDVQGLPWDAESWARASAAGTSWDGGLWRGTRWSGDSWTASGWQSARWSSARWSDIGWDSARWYSARWSSARWYSARWSDADWDSARWSSARWS
jgi:serine protease AprX